ncbi:DUF1428 domain-containing protein [Hankyongella ginsenosidimutans]|uniref:DUF1428 domain-containing protein n=1 Tax=Hankyongella ginsenosidimutans TaxID=1763828 RepID=A0A4D7CBX2_9SPHN|nr:DUF1428 domain-containing protein [Hankyongella ginsenosidimutans]QCI79302.1 DUF1428 domain-containing protein [Hankyongella ginsenosidimutans]TXG82730.1 MAG: DUF1428 domain-containing protein [Sphingomonadales bacterium]
MAYVDGFVVPVPKDKRDEYAQKAAEVAQVWKDHGALQVVECFSDDVPHGKLTDFYRAVQAEEHEGVVFSWVIWPSKEARDAGNKKIMEDPRMQSTEDMPFDGKRLIWGGFQVISSTDTLA